MARAAVREPAPRVTLVRSRTVEKVDSMGFVVLRWIQCSVGKSFNASSWSWSSVIFLTALGNFAPLSLAKVLIAASAWSRSSAL